MDATNPDNAGERRELGALIAELSGDDYVTTTEAAAVVEWCSEWVRDTFGQPDDEPQTIEGSKLTSQALLRGCQHHIDGGLAFVLADVRRVGQSRAVLESNDASSRARREERRRLYGDVAGDTVADAALAEHNAGMEVLAAKFAEQDAEQGRVQSPYRVMRQHTGTEDGSLWYVTNRAGDQISGDGHVERESAEWELSELESDKLTIELHELEIGVRAYNFCRRNSIDTLGALVALSIEDVNGWRTRDGQTIGLTGFRNLAACQDQARALLVPTYAPMAKPDLDDYSGFAR